MYHHRGRSVKTEKEYYTCGGYSKRVHPCTTHHITLNVLKQLVMADLQRVTQFAAEHEKQFVDMLVDFMQKRAQRCRGRWTPRGRGIPNWMLSSSGSTRTTSRAS
ncbi:MAG: zinc ribbon domain-containing protein [Clostridium sp.]